MRKLEKLWGSWGFSWTLEAWWEERVGSVESQMIRQNLEAT